MSSELNETNLQDEKQKTKLKNKNWYSSFKFFNLSKRQKILILTLDFNKQHLENIK